ncbi:Glycosyl transferases group 1 [compost metagenome]
MGKPIITTDNVGCRETVNHEINGFICQPQNTESLLQVLDRMIRLSHQERCEMGKQSRLKMEKEFDESLVINSYISALNEVFSHQSEQAHQATDKPNLN